MVQMYFAGAQYVAQIRMNMKKLLLSSFLVAALINCGGAIAQSFTIPHDTTTVSMATYEKLHNDITNISDTAISLTWNVVSHDFPADWAETFAVCDNITCNTNTKNNLILGGKLYYMDVIEPGSIGSFYVLPDLTNASTGTHYVQIRMTNGSYSKDSWYIVSKFATGITSVSRSDAKVVVYPNPATDELTVVCDPEVNASQIVISGLNGQNVGNYTVTGSNAKVDVDNLAPGVYSIRLIGTKGHIIGATQFVRP